MRLALVCALAAAAQAGTYTLAAPRSVMAGASVGLEVRCGGESAPGVELRVAAPAKTMGMVTAASLGLRAGPGASYPTRKLLYRDETVLVLDAGADGWCNVAVSTGATGFAPCQALARQPFGQPLGITDANGRLVAASLAAVPALIDVVAFAQGRPVASAEIRVIPLKYDRREAVAPGIRYRERRFVRDADGPFTMQILEVDPADPHVNLLPVRAHDRLAGKEPVSSMAKRYGAAAAVNGGYFVVDGPYAGTSTGVYQFNGRPLSGGAGRTALVFCEETEFVERLEMDRVNFRGRVTAGGAAIGLLGMNRPRTAEDLDLFLPQFGPSTLTDASGVEVALDRTSRVTRVEEQRGNAAIPADGTILSGAGAGAAWLRHHAVPGARLKVEADLTRLAPGCRAQDIVGGGPRLVRAGRVAVADEAFRHAPNRNPRTAVAVTTRGTFLFVTLDGRQARSAGMRLDEFASELVALGAVEAMNLDGGGSTTMVVRGRVRNSPSDRRERPVSDGILIFSIGTAEELRALAEVLAADPAQISAGLREKLRTEPLAELRRVIDANEGGELSVAAARLLREALWGIARAGGEPRR